MGVVHGDEQCLIVETKPGCGLKLPKKYNSDDFKKDMPDMGLFFKPKQKYQTILDNIDSHLTCFQLRTGGSLGFAGDFVYSEAPRAKCVYKYIIEKANEFDKDAVLFTDAKDLSTSFLQDAKRAVKLPYTIEHIDRNHKFSGFERVAIEISLISKCDYIFYHKGSSFIRNSLFLAKETAKITDTAKWQDDICTKRTEQLNIAKNSPQETAIRNPNNPQEGWLSIVTRCPHHETNAARLVEIWSTLEHNTQHPERPVVHMLCTEMEYTAFHTILDKYKVIVHRIPHDSTYEDLFDVAASIDGIKMVVNSDISLHEGIEYIPSVVDDEHALALSRHASDAMCLHKNVSKSPGNDQCLHYVGSHDAFVFSGTLDIGHLLKGIFPHYWGSENVVLYELTKVRKVINLCHQIKIYHQHCIAYFSKSKEDAPRVNSARSRVVSPSRKPLEAMHISKHSDLKHVVEYPDKLQSDASPHSEEGTKSNTNTDSKSNTNTDSNIGKVIIKNNMGFNRDEPCDIPCHYTTGSGPVDATVYELRGRRAPPSGISVYMQMEGEHYYPIDTTGWTVENTYRWSSPLLKPYFEWIHYHDETDIQSKRVAQDAIDGVSFLARHCQSRNNREQVVKDLMSAGIRVDSMSHCMHNYDKPFKEKGTKWIPYKIKLLRGWKFHAAFENGNVRDYVTEKVYTTLAAGTVPIYMGASNIDEFVPKGSIIRVDSFENTAALAKHIHECLRNETLYQSYHEWRDRPLNSEFVEKFAFTNVSTECRTCRWVYAHKHGLPWDKKSQTFVKEKPNTSKSSLITKDITPLPSLRYVDPFIGTASTGHTTPGAKAPFGMMYMVPVNAYDPMGSKWWEYTAGYQYGDKTFSGIAHTALTGTGIPGLLDIKISPFEDSRNKNNEIAHPGYYSVTVDGVHISVVAGNRFGIHHYAGTSELFLKSKQCSADATKNTIRGSCSAYFNEKWEKKKYPYKVHFYIELPSDCTYQQKKISCSNNNIEMKMAISYVDQDGAKRNFDDENTDWESLYKKTSSDWARSIDKIQVHGWKSEKQRKIFSSALYRTMLSPYTHNDADGRIRGPDGNIYKVDFTYYTFLSTWDTYRAWSAVMRLVRPDVLTDIAKTSVFHYKTMGIMPRWTVAGLDIQMMPGVPSINIAFQAWRWGLTDTKLTKDIYDAIVGTLESKNKYKEGHLDAFVEKGVVPCNGKFQETVSQSLELGLNARCATELASHLHDIKESTWRNLSLAYQRHYDPTYNYLVGVNGANFCKPGSPYKVDANPELYTEGNAITWLWSGPFEGVKSLLGPELFKQRLHELFTKSVGVVSKRDYSGLIGAYAHGNEPTHHVPFWFKQNGDEATTNKYVHQILDTLYLDTPDGLPGNDDAGQISAWYVLATLGIYPVDPLAKEFQTHEPSVQYAVLNEPSGLRHTLTPTTKKEHHVVKYTIPDSLKAYVTTHPEGGLFVKTGDIPEMWIRDSVAQVWPYRDSHSGMIAEVLYRQSEFILHDVYANSYNLKWQVSNKLNHHMQTLGRGEWVGTRNYELDSGCYFLRLLYHAWKKHQLEIKTFRPTVELLVETWQVEQYHEEQSPYRYPELKRNGLGTPVGWTGMTWTGFRPSDDPCTYGYHIPDNLFAAKALEYVSEMFPDIKEAKILRQDILMGVQEYGTWTDNDGKKRYCYEVDGLGGCNKMDDANVPSLLSIPYIENISKSHNVPHILISGPPRSGTTLFGELVHKAIPKSQIVFELMNPDCSLPCNYKRPRPKSFVRKDDVAEMDTSREWWNYVDNLLKTCDSDILILKDPIALFNAELFWKNGVIKKVIIKFRDPLGLIDSDCRRHHNFKKESCPNSEIKHFLKRRKREFEAILDYESRYALHPDWIFVKHEQWALSPITTSKQIFQELDLEWSEEIEKWVIEHTQATESLSQSYHDLRFNSKELIRQQGNLLTPEQRRFITLETEHFRKYFGYTEDIKWFPRRNIWQNTYDWIWSSKNPYFFEGTAAAGIGSPHTPHNYIWPMSLVMRGLVDPTVAEEMREQIEKTKVRGTLHESFHKDDPKRLTREDFSWPNELYKELKI